MIHRRRVTPPRFAYPVDPWRIVETRFYPEYLGMMESIFSVGNGYMGFRGMHDEAEPVQEQGCFVNGFHDTWPIVYGENAYGFAKTGQTMCNVPSAMVMRLFVDDEPFYLPTADVRRYERVLDMQAGLLSRDVIWETPGGKLVEVRTERCVSLVHRHLCVQRMTVTLLEGSSPIAIFSELKAPPKLEERLDDPRLARLSGIHLEEEIAEATEMELALGLRARDSRMGLGCAVSHSLSSDEHVDIQADPFSEASPGRIVFATHLNKGQSISVEKFAAYHTSRRASCEELVERGRQTVARALRKGAEDAFSAQRQTLERIWRDADVVVEMDSEAESEELAQAIRFNIFQLLQAGFRSEGAGIPAKGLTGQAYEGHYFWDSEIYALPFFIYTNPRVARNQLRFRFSMLDKARQRARELNQMGAMFPWRTINGDEASAYYAAGTAQFHINADIAYTLRKYVTVTGDTDFLYREGAEPLVETARLWLDLGFFSDRKGGAFCIDGVTGPDEYTTVVDNNLFTNLMARENMLFACETVEAMASDARREYQMLVAATGLRPSEPAEWRRAAEAMFIPYDEELGIHLQDDSFLEKEEWDFANTPAHKYPLLLHYHPLTIYRYKVIKQADAVLAMYLLGSCFTLEEKRRNFDYYDRYTTGDSSLSVGVQCIVASEIGDMEKAREYFIYAMLMDLGDVAGNAKDGLHIASMGATWMTLTGGLLGLRDDDGLIRFRPRWLKRIRRVAATLMVRGARIGVEMRQRTIRYTLLEGGSAVLYHGGDKVSLTRDEPEAERPVFDTPEEEEAVTGE